MIITPKQPRDGKTVSRLGNLVPYMLRGKGEERCTWYMAGNLEGLDRREDAELAVEVMEVLQAHAELEAPFDPPRYKLAMGRAAPKTASALLPSSAAQARVFDRSWVLASGLGGFGLDVGV